MVYYNILGIFIIRGVGGLLLGEGIKKLPYSGHTVNSIIGFSDCSNLDVNAIAHPPRLSGCTKRALIQSGREAGPGGRGGGGGGGGSGKGSSRGG